MTASARTTANVANSTLLPQRRQARTHCQTSRHRPGEEEEFAELHHSLLAQLSPEGALEMALFRMLAHAASQLMANGLDSLLDQRTAKTLDRLQRYTSSNQRTYFSALREPRVVQNNRLLRLAAEGEDDDTPLPELVSVAKLTKRTQKMEADAESAEWLAMKAFIDSPLPGMRQNEAMPHFTQFRQAMGLPAQG